MVINSNDAGVAVAVAADQSSANGNPLLPNGNYILVAVDIDTTGRRLIDEIVQLAAYTPSDHFEQYIMPYMNLNPAARQRHQIRVVSIGFFRMLKSMQNYKIIKSKSEVAALKDFLDWLDQLLAKTSGSDGIVLVYHEERKFTPYMILQSLVKYGMLERFNKVVKYFVNSFGLAKSSFGDTKRYNLRTISNALSKGLEESNNNQANVADKNEVDATKSAKVKNRIHKDHKEFEFDGNASVRVKLSYTVALQLGNQSQKGFNVGSELASKEALSNLFNALKPFVEPISIDVKELDTENLNLDRQNSFRPVFLNYFKTTLYHRVRAVKFRIVLAENGFDLTTLNDIWAEKGFAGLKAALEGIDLLKQEDKTELVELLDSFFDPTKMTLKPIIKPGTFRRRTKRNGFGPKSSTNASTSTSTEFGAGGDKSQSNCYAPDSTTKTPSPGKNFGRAQRKRNSRLNVKDINSTETAALNNSAPPGMSVPIAVAN